MKHFLACSISLLLLFSCKPTSSCSKFLGTWTDGFYIANISEQGQKYLLKLQKGNENSWEFLGTCENGVLAINKYEISIIRYELVGNEEFITLSPGIILKKK